MKKIGEKWKNVEFHVKNHNFDFVFKKNILNLHSNLAGIWV